MIHNFKTGKLGLSDPEIKKERQDIFESMCKRRNLDPKACGSKIGYTPTELHREQVLWAMSMANSILCYGGTKEQSTTHGLNTREFGVTQTHS